MHTHTRRLQKSEGMGVVTADPATLVALGGCPSANQVHYFLPASTDTDKICKVRGGGLLAAASGGPWNINKGHARARRPFPHRWAALCNLQL